MVEVIRRLRLNPEVEATATSHRRENVAAARLYASLGFVPWNIGYAEPDGDEVYLTLSGRIGTCSRRPERVPTSPCGEGEALPPESDLGVRRSCRSSTADAPLRRSG